MPSYLSAINSPHVESAEHCVMDWKLLPNTLFGKTRSPDALCVLCPLLQIAQTSAGLETRPPPARKRHRESAQLPMGTSRGRSPAAGAFAGRLCAGHVDSTPNSSSGAADADWGSP